MRPSKRGRRPVSPRVRSIRSWEPLEATQLATPASSSRSSVAPMPSTSTSSVLEGVVDLRPGQLLVAAHALGAEPLADLGQLHLRGAAHPAAHHLLGADRPAQPGQHPGLDRDLEHLAVDQDTVTVEEHEGGWHAAKCTVRPGSGGSRGDECGRSACVDLPGLVDYGHPSAVRPAGRSSTNDQVEADGEPERRRR